jgi:hypothetical protein
MKNVEARESGRYSSGHHQLRYRTRYLDPNQMKDVFDDGLDPEVAVTLPGPRLRRPIARAVDSDHIGSVAMVCNLRVARQLDVAAPERSVTEAQVKYGTTAFEAQEAFVEVDTSGTGGGEDEVAEVEGLGRDHFTSLSPAVGIFFFRSFMHESARNF